jgi:hypothetical protein
VGALENQCVLVLLPVGIRRYRNEMVANSLTLLETGKPTGTLLNRDKP